jgi:predicted metal-dependent hydrolase
MNTKQKYELTMGKEKFTIILERKPVKYLRLKISGDGSLNAVAPPKLTLKEINNFIVSKESWIKKHLKKIAETKQNQKPVYENGIEVLYLGNTYRLNVIESKRNNVFLLDDEIVIHSKNPEMPELTEAIYNLFLKYQGYVYFEGRLNKYMDIMKKYGISKPGLLVRQMKSRWGSCNKRLGKITLNSELMKFPPDCIDYVIIHELCHLKYQNHQKEFYNFVSVFMPDWNEKRNKIKNFRKN